MSKKDESLTIVIGCGRLGSYIANQLSLDGKSVIIIDRKQESFKLLSSSFGGITLVGNGTDLDILTKTKISSTSTIIAVTDYENNNILIGLLAYHEFNCKNIIVRIDNDDKKELIKDTPIKALCPYQLSSNVLVDLIKGEK